MHHPSLNGNHTKFPRSNFASLIQSTVNRIRLLYVTSTLHLVHCSPGDGGRLVRTDQTLPGTKTRLEVTERARLAYLQAIQRVASRLTLPCKHMESSQHDTYNINSAYFAFGINSCIIFHSIQSEVLLCLYLCTQPCCGSVGRPWRFPQSTTYTPADPPGPGRSPASSSHTRYIPERSTFPPGIGLRQGTPLVM